MATVAVRKKSIVSTSSLHIDTNTLLNKAASQSTSLYQQCSALRSRLRTIKGFAPFFAHAAATTDPVNQLWDLFASGSPLCYIFDQLPAEQGFPKINHSFDPAQFDANPDRQKKHAIALFAMQMQTDIVKRLIPKCDSFTVRDLWDRSSTDGLVTVINTVTAIVDYLPPTAFESAPPSPPAMSDNGSVDSLADTLVSQPAITKESSARNNNLKELVETERKYVQDLEIMQKYSTALAQQNVMDQDTIHLLFPGLNKLLNFQRKFLIRIESIAELPWPDQRWGLPFIENEDEFVVYEPYCANYPNAIELLLANEQNLAVMNHMIQVKGELPGLLIKPIQRICKYFLMLESLMKAIVDDKSYPYHDELREGYLAAKRIADKINEAQRRAENEQIVKSLASRIDDWKGHHLENFGRLLLDDIFVVTKSDIDREYHVFLFEKIILCCKEAPGGVVPGGKNGKGQGKNGSALKKQPAPLPLAAPGGPGGSSGQPQKNTPLLLKGRIFLGNVTQAVPAPVRLSSVTGVATYFPLSVWWKGDDDLEFFTLRCRQEAQMKKWETTINRLIQETARAKGLTRPSGLHKLAQVANGQTTSTGSTSSSMSTGSSRQQGPTQAQQIVAQHQASQQASSPYSQMSSASSSTYSHSSQSSSGTLRHHSTSAAPSRAQSQYSSAYDHLDMSMSSYGSGPQGYPPHDGFEMEDEDDLEDYPPSAVSYSGPGGSMAMGVGVSAATTGTYSGPGTPVSGVPNGPRRNGSTLSMPPERGANNADTGYERPRAQTEGVDGPNMQQWRNGGLPSMPLSAVPPNSAARPITPRLNSASSYASDASFGNGVNGNGSSSANPTTATATRPALRTQYSSTRLRTAGVSSPANGPYDAQSPNSTNPADYHSHLHYGTTRGRSGTPTAPLPPVPTNAGGPAGGLAPPVMSRSRSASQPSAYVPPPNTAPPPLPQPPHLAHSSHSYQQQQQQQQWNRDREYSRSNPSGGVPMNVNPINGSSVPNGKRGSGSSGSATGGDESSDYSPNSSSPITPFGSSESSLVGGAAGNGIAFPGSNGMRSSRSQTFSSTTNDGAGAGIGGPPVKVKVHFHEDIFVIQVSRATEYGELVEKVGRKIRLCGPRRDDGPLRVRYRDEDGDMISLGSTEDVQMAFEQYRPGGQVTLFVT